MSADENPPVLNQNQLKDTLYQIGNAQNPETVWEWFFKYFAGGESLFRSEPADFIENYKTLFQMAVELINAKYPDSGHEIFIRDGTTPSWTYYFVGDTHGSFSDTYILIDYFIQAFQANPHIKVVWLGDMVDRNPYDLQNLAFIVAFWIIFRNNVFIIRGNHEDASVCSRYGFSQHLYDKVQSRESFNEVWELVNTFFSKLPLGMMTQVGQKRILAVHGGIPFNYNDYQPINIFQAEIQLQAHKTEHFDMDPLSQAILWSDPDPNMESGVANSPRTGRPRFSRAAFDAFMDLNQFDILIRGHEKFTEGYRLYWENRLISLFSTSTYDGKKIGQAKFLRLSPEVMREEIGDEYRLEGKGILEIEPTFLTQQLRQYYSVMQSQEE